MGRGGELRTGEQSIQIVGRGVVGWAGSDFVQGQFKMASMRSEMPICTPSRLSEVTPSLPLSQYHLVV